LNIYKIDNLINQWSFTDNLKDSIRNCDFKKFAGLIEYSFDRFEVVGRSLNLYNAYVNAPTSTYFYNEFTIVIWFNRYYTPNVYFDIALFDFSFNNSQNIGLAIISKEIIFWTKNATGSIIRLKSNYQINNKQWYHVAITYSNSSKLIYSYINGVLVNSLYVDLILGETNLNYIGKSNSLNVILSVVLIDEIKIYNRILDSNEIKVDSNDRPVPATTIRVTSKTKYDDCYFYHCNNEGYCLINNNGQATCKCYYEYYGDHCESYVPVTGIIMSVVCAIIFLPPFFCFWCCIVCKKKPRNQNETLNVTFTVEATTETVETNTNNSQVTFNRSESVISYESALRNSTPIVQPINQSDLNECKLPNYKEFISTECF
jgi:hypothetical protein